MNKPIRQHYVPRMILKRFAIDDKIFVFDKTTTDEKKSIYQTNIQNTALEKNIYTISDEKDQISYCIEERFSEIEQKASTVINQIHENFCHPLSNDEKLDLVIFVTFQILRTPFSFHQFQEMVSESQNILNFIVIHGIDNLIQELENEPLKNAEEIREAKHVKSFLLKDPGKFWFDDKYLFSMLFRFEGDSDITISELLIDNLIKKNFIFLKATGCNGFIITDNPFILTSSESHKNNQRITLSTPSVKVVCPLSKDLCLVLEESNRDKFYRVFANKDTCDSINYDLALNSHRFIYSHDIFLLKEAISMLNKRGERSINK